MIVTEEAATVLDSDADTTGDAKRRTAEWAEERAAGATYREIGDRHGVSHERVRQVLKEAGYEPVPRNWAARLKKEELAKDITTWLKANGPVPAGVVHEEFDITSARLSELVHGYHVPKEYIMSGAVKHIHGATIDDVAAGVKTVWDRVLEEDPSVTGLSVGLYDRTRLPGEPSPAMITSRFGWRAVCEAAGVPTAGTGRPVYIPKWTDEELVGWVGTYTRDQVAHGGKVTFDGYDQWRLTREGAPSGAALRTRLRRAGYDSWAAMVSAGSEAAPRRGE